MAASNIEQTIFVAKPDRRPDLDWLRVLAVLLLIPFHTARIFDTFEPFYVKNGELSGILSYGVIGFLSPWHMPLLFLLAGAATWYALGFRSAGQYVKERLSRLLVPFVFGLAVIVPPQAYCASLAQPGSRESFVQFYPRFFHVDPDDLTGYFGTFTPGHLWFILFLFIFSLLALPLFLFLRTATGRRLTAGLASRCAGPGGIFLFAIPLALAGMIPSPSGPNPSWCLALFIFGYVLMADERFQQGIGRHKTVALGLGIMTMGAVLALRARNIGFSEFSLGNLIVRSVYVLNTWFWLVALLGFGHRYLTASTRLLRYASEAAYPFYLLHQTAIVATGFYVVRWDAGIAAKFVVICVASTAATLAVYDLLVKRTNVARVLFGMKPLRRKAGRRERPATLNGRR